MFRVYGETRVNGGVVRKWCQKFKDGRIDVHDEKGQERKSVTTEDIVQQIHQTKQKSLNKPLTIESLWIPSFGMKKGTLLVEFMTLGSTV